MKRSICFTFFVIFLSFLPFPVVSLELKPITVTDDITWKLETTSGWQNITNLLVSKEDGGSSQIQKGLTFKGILFHSFWRNIQTLKSQLNLGFESKQNFLWTDKPDFHHTENRLNESLECIEFDIQTLFPYRFFYSLSFSPYVGYSFIDYSYEDNFVSSNGNSVMYNSMVVGMSLEYRMSKVFSESFFFSYSPIVFENYTKSKMQFINYGFEVITDTHPISLTFFVVNKKAFLQKGRLIFEGTYFKFTTSELGFSFHMNLR